MRDLLFPIVVCWGVPLLIAFALGVLIGAVWFGRVRIRLERREG